MHGTVVAVIDERVVVRIARGVAILDVVGDHLTDVGDILSGEFAAAGGEALRNETTGESIIAFIDGEDGSATQMIEANIEGDA